MKRALNQRDFQLKIYLDNSTYIYLYHTICMLIHQTFQYLSYFEL